MKDIIEKPGPVRVPGADEPKNALEVFKIQLENFSNSYIYIINRS